MKDVVNYENDEKPPYKDPFLYEPGDAPGISLHYPQKYTREILDIRNWVQEHKEQVFKALNCVNFSDIEGVFNCETELYDFMQSSGYFEGDRKWMADPDNRSIVLGLITIAGDFKGPSPN